MEIVNAAATALKDVVAEAVRAELARWAAPGEGRMMNRNEAARYLGVSVSQFQKWERDLGIPRIELPEVRGHQAWIWYSRTDLDEFIARYRRERRGEDEAPTAISA